MGFIKHQQNIFKKKIVSNDKFNAHTHYRLILVLLCAQWLYFPLLLLIFCLLVLVYRPHIELLKNTQKLLLAVIEKLYRMLRIELSTLCIWQIPYSLYYHSSSAFNPYHCYVLTLVSLHLSSSESLVHIDLFFSLVKQIWKIWSFSRGSWLLSSP